MDFSGKVVVITGASSGIGAACAAAFAQHSAALVLVGRNRPNLERVAQQCRELAGAEPLVLCADVSVDADVERVVADTVDKLGRIDVLVNNAGITSVGGLGAGVAALDAVMATNTRAPYLLAGLALPHLARSRGNVVNVSSCLSTKPNTMLMPYCMSKAALDMFTKCLALEAGPQGVRVNAVNPGPVRTEIFRRAGVSAADNERLYAGLEGALPLGRVADAAEVADLVVYLASARARSVTGACYPIDCGLLLGENTTI